MSHLQVARRHFRRARFQLTVITLLGERLFLH